MQAVAGFMQKKFEIGCHLKTPFLRENLACQPVPKQTIPPRHADIANFMQNFSAGGKLLYDIISNT